MIFPTNPKHGTIFELSSGLFFKYDATTNAWIKIASNGLPVSVATDEQPGAMSAIDLKKLNRMVLPPPLSSIVGTDCLTPFKSGNINLYSGDKLVKVDGTVKVRNVGSRGEIVSEDVPFHIHQHTYGFDFTIDLPELIDELKLRGQYNVIGPKGPKGQKGATGAPGPDLILTGPPGEQGEEGAAPECSLTVEDDNVQLEAKQGLGKALVGGRVVVDEEDPLKYKIVLDRQYVGPVGYAADRVHVRDDESPWVLAVTGDQPDGPITTVDQLTCTTTVAAGRPQQIYYVDIEPVVASIRERFLREAEIIRGSYQNMVKFWIQTMSDLFDEQKSSMCCSLEHCRSVHKNIDARQHMESVAAAAAGSANVLLHGRDSDEVVSMSSTRTLKQVGGPDPCRGGPRFPQFPNLQTGGSGGFGTPSEDEGEAEAQKVAVSEATVEVDPLLHSTLGTAVQVPLKAGDYVATITKAGAQIDGIHRANVKIQHVDDGVHRSTQFLNKGEFAGLLDAKLAYEGLAVSFHHDGGSIAVWLPSFAPKSAAGMIEIAISQASKQVAAAPVVKEAPAPAPAPAPVPAPVVLPPEPEPEPEPAAIQEPEPEPELIDSCRMSVAHLAWYQRGWESGNCCGLVINVMGQDYIIVKRSLGNEMGCGGGESIEEPCLATFIDGPGHPAFAWPTFDGKTFVPLPTGDFVTFRFDKTLNDEVTKRVADGDYEDGKGKPAGIRHLTYQMTTILFPAS